MMDQEYIDNNSSHDIRRLMEELNMMQNKVNLLTRKIHHIQTHCMHIFLEIPGMRKCQKCGYAESTYY